MKILCWTNKRLLSLNQIEENKVKLAALHLNKYCFKKKLTIKSKHINGCSKLCVHVCVRMSHFLSQRV